MNEGFKPSPNVLGDVRARIDGIRNRFSDWVNQPADLKFREGLQKAAGGTFLAGAVIENVLTREYPQIVPVPTGEMPIVEGLPNPTIETPDFEGREFSQIIRNVNQRPLPKVEENVDYTTLTTGTFVETITESVILPDKQVVPFGGRRFDVYTGDSYDSWAHIRTLGKETAEGYIVEKLSNQPTLEEVKPKDLPPEIQALYKTPQTVDIPLAHGQSEITKIFKLDQLAQGGAVTSGDPIADMWGNPTTRQVKSGQTTVTAPFTPTTH